MKSRIIFLLSCFLLSTIGVEAQTTVSKFSEKSGLFFKGSSSINYNVSDKRFSLTLNNREGGEVTTDNLFPNRWVLESDFGVSVSENAYAVFTKGKFNPGMDASVLIGREIELSDASNGYFMPFARIGYENSQNKYAYAFSETVDSLIIEDVWKHTGGAHVGVNMYYSRLSALSFTGTYLSTWKGEDDLKKRTIFSNVFQGVDTTGAPVVVSSSDERYFGRPNSRSEVLKARFDFFILPFRFKGAPNIPSIGFLVSGETKYREGVRPRYSISVGPTVHLPTKVSDDDESFATGKRELLLAILFQLNDLETGMPHDEIWGQQFRANVAIGVPFSVLTLK